MSPSPRHPRSSAVLLGCGRTPYCRRHGALAEFDAVELARLTVSRMLEELNIRNTEITGLYFASAAGPFGGLRPDRSLCLGAGLRARVQCEYRTGGMADGLKMAFEAAKASADDSRAVCIAAAAESVSRLPFLAHDLKPGARGPFSLVDGSEALIEWDMAGQSGRARLEDELSRSAGAGRLDVDLATLRLFRSRAPGGSRGDSFMTNASPIVEVGGVRQDDRPTPPADLEALSRERPMEGEGLHTLWTLPPMMDGAAAAVISGKEAVSQKQRGESTTLADWNSVSRDPKEAMTSVRDAAMELLDRNDVSLEEVGAWEIVEHSAGRLLGTMDVLKLEDGRVNFLGGALTHGLAGAAEPLAALGRLDETLKIKNLRWGLLLCDAGGGEALAALLFRGKDGTKPV